FVPLSERNYRKSHTLKVLHHLNSTPTVICDFTDIVFLTQGLDKFLDVAVMDYIALGGHKQILSFPNVIRHMVTANTQVNVIFRYPEIRQNDIFIILIFRWEHQHECRDIRSA